MKKNNRLGKTELKKAIAGLVAVGNGNNGLGNQIHVEVAVKRDKKLKVKPVAVKVATPPAEKPTDVAITTTATTTTTSAEPEKSGPSLLEEILQAGKMGAQVVQAINMANAILTDKGAVETFVGAVSAADALFVQKFGFNRHQDEVRAELRDMDLQQLEKRLQDWSRSGDEAAKNILTTLAAFKKSAVNVTGPLWQLYSEIVRPAMEVRSYYGLAQLLRQLFAKGLVEKAGWKHYPQRTVVLNDGRSSTGYLPAKNHGNSIPIIEATWPWIKQAEERAAEVAEGRREKLTSMESEATGLTPQAALSGEEGKVFFRTGMSNGALLHIGDKRVRVVQTIGMPYRATGWINLNAGQKAWPDVQLFNLFYAWMKKATSAPAKTTTTAAPAETTVTSAQTAE